MVTRDRSSRPELVFVNIFLTVAIMLSGCTQPPPKQSAVKTFIRAVAQHIEEHSEFGFSETEIYLTILSKIPDETIYEFGDRTCETLRRGGSSQQIADTIQTRFSRDDERKTYMHIAQTAENTLCPASTFPVEPWRRSLFFWIERLNGGTPL